MSFDFSRPVEQIVGLVILMLIYVALIPTLINAVTSLAAVAGLGVFATVIGTVTPLIIGAAILMLVISRVMALKNG